MKTTFKVPALLTELAREQYRKELKRMRKYQEKVKKLEKNGPIRMFD